LTHCVKSSECKALLDAIHGAFGTTPSMFRAAANFRAAHARAGGVPLRTVGNWGMLLPWTWTSSAKGCIAGFASRSGFWR
jgi:hypothetical protein